MADLYLGQSMSAEFLIQSAAAAYTQSSLPFQPDFWQVDNLTANSDGNIMRAWGYRGMTDAHAFVQRRILDDGNSTGSSMERVTSDGFTLTVNAAGVDSSEASNSITGATAADPVVITLNSHGFSDGDIIRITDVGGAVELNNRRFRVNNSTANTFELQDPQTRQNVDGSNHTAYTSGGRANLLSRVDANRDVLDAESYDLLLGTNVMGSDDDNLRLLIMKYGSRTNVGDVA